MHISQHTLLDISEVTSERNLAQWDHRRLDQAYNAAISLAAQRGCTEPSG
jgi:hypothetical protein